MEKVVVMWSGGKESTLACCKALSKGYNVTSLATFILDSWPTLCHPLHLMPLQSEALGIPHQIIDVGEPYREGYRQALTELKESRNIQGIVAGDIWITEHRRWYESVSKGLGIEVILPLWNLQPYRILCELVSKGFRAVFTCVRHPWFDAAWIGQELDRNRLEVLKMLCDKHRIDPCGESGEYHTMVIDGPIFEKAIKISKFSVEESNEVLRMKINHCSLKSKNAQESIHLQGSATHGSVSGVSR